MAGQPTSEDPRGAGGARVGGWVLRSEEIVFLGVLNLGIFASSSYFSSYFSSFASDESKLVFRAARIVLTQSRCC